MELGSRPSVVALRDRLIPFPGGWLEQLVVVAVTGLAFVFLFFL
jgi:hypothetical protein